MKQIAAQIRDVSDFPKPGIVFKDITPLLRDPAAMHQAIQSMIAPFQDHPITVVAGIEARGFVFGALVASQLRVGFVPLRKPGKLPYQTQQIDYDLEYGNASLQIHRDAITEKDRVLIVDDVLATGGTALASCQLVETLGAEVAGCSFLLEISALQGRQKLAAYTLHSVLQYS
ncbi:Adenine phosphoribosyltransferase [Methylophaga frappieri]|uniref:Adenine phosphoribosyltransferase n=1 Tax=Methylophaga frappieri (strain ATCC BAA-2434 / DSM 25690 / JAM7) TaxID=754477 RepID=I1YEH2_METFJ|nr:adenine phosphoribosyltransferase [Methylophaga frappieri]AFJ01315.1 Adenine phosphoribosyltransferase [Methylophaga frappieri]